MLGGSRSPWWKGLTSSEGNLENSGKQGLTFSAWASSPLCADAHSGFFNLSSPPALLYSSLLPTLTVLREPSVQHLFSPGILH